MTDKKFRIVWTIWLLAVVASFFIFEVWAVTSGGTTLSRYIWEASQAWPIIPIVFVIAIVAIIIHLWGSSPPPGPVG